MVRRGIVVAAIGWALVPALAGLGAGGGTSAFDPGFLALCGLLLLAPAGLFLPAARATGAALWGLEAVLCWGLLGYLLVFVDPRALERGHALSVFLVALFGVVASPALLWAARRGRAAGDARRARRQGYLVAGLLCGALLLRALGALTPLNGVLLTLIAASGQGLLLTHGRAASGVPRGGDAAPAPAIGPARLDLLPGAAAAPARPVLVAPLRPAAARPIGRART